MIVGVGVDVVDLARFAASLQRTPGLRERLFTSVEQGLPEQSLAGRFAAKEALAKALGAPPGLEWHDCEVAREESGRPRLELRGTVLGAARAAGVTSSHLSISHDGGVAVAYVVLEGDRAGSSVADPAPPT